MGKSSKSETSGKYCKHLLDLDLEVLSNLAESGKEIRCSDCDEQGKPQQKIVCIFYKILFPYCVFASLHV